MVWGENTKKKKNSNDAKRKQRGKGKKKSISDNEMTIFTRYGVAWNIATVGNTFNKLSSKN